MEVPRDAISRVLAIVALGALGCVARIHYDVEPQGHSAPQCVDPSNAHPGPEIVGIAMSGGGSRAAVFGASGLEALWEQGLLDLATHISSVSGGSIAASYFIANRPDCDHLPSDAETEACWRQFFAEYKRAMRSDYFSAMLRRQLYKARVFSATRRASSLQESLDERFLHGVTFGDLAANDAKARERGSPHPVLLVNASSYDEARRFVFSNMCLSADPVLDAESRASRPLTRVELRALTFSRPGCDMPVPPDLPLSLAVATSASFPGIGPVSFEVPETCQGGEPEYWHLGDGGIFDNSGVDTLEEVILRNHPGRNGKLERTLILSVHSGMKAKPEELRRIRNFWLYLQHPGLMFDIAARRGQAYHDLVWERMEHDLAAEGIAFEKIEMRYTDAMLDQWPDSCEQAARARRDGRSEADVRADIAKHLSEIPTDLEITDCDADLLELAAHDIVHTRLDAATMRQLREKGFPVHPPHQSSRPSLH
jgi:hypothetical protein